MFLKYAFYLLYLPGFISRLLHILVKVLSSLDNIILLFPGLTNISCEVHFRLSDTARVKLLFMSAINELVIGL